MTSTLRSLQFFTLGTWVGSILYFSIIVAPGAFRMLANADQAADMIGYSLGRLHIAGIALGLVYLLATLALGRSSGVLGRPASLLVFLMIALTWISQFHVLARMHVLRLEAGSIFATPPDSPLRVAFDRLHTFSVWIEGVVAILGVAALYLTARAAKSAPAATPARE
ncbi:MAG: DUF4149 domain-containing protein [Candidatus Acidiferrales bacterium]